MGWPQDFERGKRIARHLSVASAVTIAALTIGSASASRSPGVTGDGATGKIVFALQVANLADPGLYQFAGGGDSRIAVVNTDGSGLALLTKKSSATDTDPVWSPDGRTIAFCRDGWHIYTISATGSDEHAVAPSVDGQLPRWSPLGDRLAFVSPDGGGLFVASPGGDVQEVASDATAFQPAEWASDDQSLLYSADLGNGHSALKVINIDDLSSATVVNTFVDEASWSPDGRKIAFTASGGPSDSSYTLKIADRDGTHLRTVARGLDQGYDYPNSPQWSPDGSRLLVDVLGTRGHPQIAVVNVNDGHLTRLTDASTGVGSYTPRWALDGREVVFVKERSRTPGVGTDLWLMNADGTGQKELTNALDQDGGLDYAPDSSTGTSTANPVELPKLEKLTIPPAEEVDTHSTNELAFMAANNSTVAFSPASGGVRLWSRSKKRFSSLQGTCDYCWGAEGLGFAGARLAWSYASQHAGDAWSDVYVAKLDVRKPFHVIDVDWKRGFVGNVHTSGSLIVFNYWTGHARWNGPSSNQKAKLVRVSGHRTKVIASGPWTAPAAIAIDHGRIALVERDGSVIVLDSKGRHLDRFTISTPSPRDALLHDNRLVVLGAASIDTYDVQRHAKVQTQPVELGISGYARLIGERNGLLVYVAGIAVHVVRLSDGEDKTLDFGQRAGPAVAALVASGLYFGDEEAYGPTRGGVIDFIPTSALQAVFGHRD
jgi:Tol biopolymer transport system component